MSLITAPRFRLLLGAGVVVLAVANGPAPAVADPAGQNRVREQLGEIGAWAVPSTSTRKPLASDSRSAIVREKLGEIGAWAVPSTSSKSRLVSEKRDVLNPSAPPAIGASRNGGFEWRDAAIGASALVALCAAAAAAVAVRKRLSPATR